jgi:hypothetical protein
VDQALADALETHWAPADGEYGAAATIDLGDGPVSIDQPGAYRLTGKLADGQVTVDVARAGLVQLVFDGVDITSLTSAAVNIEAADEVVIILADGSTNHLTDATSYARPDEEPDAALFSKVDLSITGSGALNVTGRAGDGITSKDGLVIAGGAITVTSVDDAVKGRDYLRVAGGSLAVEAGGDGLKATNADDAGAGYVLFEGGAVTVEAGTDCVDAASDALVTAGDLALSCGDDGIHGEARLVVDGGSVAVEQSYEGLEAPVLVVAGGDIRVVASDDGLNAAAATTDAAEDAAGGGTGARRGGMPSGGMPGGGAMGVQDGVVVAITGGSVWIEAGADGIDANGPGTISGGSVTVYAAANGMEGPFDIAESGPVITGGTVVAYGTGGGGGIIAPLASSTQGWLAASFDSAEAGGITLVDQTGTTVGVLEPDRAVSAVVYSSPDVANSGTYLLSRSSQTVEVTAGQAMTATGGGFGGRDNNTRPGRRS